MIRMADGGDKIAAFERGASDEEMHLAFETGGIYTYVVDETYLVGYAIKGPTLVEVTRRRLYNGAGTDAGIQAFLRSEARLFGCSFVVGASL